MQLRKGSLLWDVEVFILKIYILDWRKKKIHLSFLQGEDWELGLGTAWPSGSELDQWNRHPPGKNGAFLLFCGMVLLWWSLFSVFGGVCVCGWMSACKWQCVPVWVCAKFPCEPHLCGNLRALSPMDAILRKISQKTRWTEIKSKL